MYFNSRFRPGTIWNVDFFQLGLQVNPLKGDRLNKICDPELDVNLRATDDIGRFVIEAIARRANQ